MKEFINIMLKDYKKDAFTQQEIIMYGVVAPSIINLLAIIIGSALS